MSKKQTRIRGTEVEDILLKKGIKDYKKDYRAITLFMQRNAEALGTSLERFYGDAGKPGSEEFGKAVSRVRRRTLKMLTPKEDVTNPRASTSVEEEYVEESDDSDKSVDLEKELAEDDTRFCVEAEVAEVDGKEPYQERDEVLSKINTASSTKDKLDKGKRPRKKKKAAMSEVMEALPGLIREAAMAAKEHTKALKRWSKKLPSSSSDDD